MVTEPKWEVLASSACERVPQEKMITRPQGAYLGIPMVACNSVYGFRGVVE